MSLFQVRSGGSSFSIRNEEGIKRIVKFVKFNIHSNRFNNERFTKIREYYGIIEIPSGDLNNLMSGKFKITK